MLASSIKEGREADQTRSGVVGGRARPLSGIAAVSALAALVALPAGTALAKRMVGTNGADKIVGTNKPDRINGRGGKDQVKGRKGADLLKGSRGGDRLAGGKGADRLKGSRGRDRISGGPAKDRLAGGKGGDRLNAVDGKKDAAVNAGPGKDVCVIDRADLALLKNCEKAKVKNGTPGGGGGRGGGLRVTSASGLTCGSAAPLCNFQLAGDGAGAPIGTVSGGGGVSLAVGAGVSIEEDAWQAAGLYGCADDGYLEVTIGSESMRVPITCTG
jgi:hemolysin type calcium-binding protein